METVDKIGLSFSPFLECDKINPNGMGIIDFMTRTPIIISNERKPSNVNHFIHLSLMSFLELPAGADGCL
jgi:hypothetical protein